MVTAWRSCANSPSGSSNAFLQVDWYLLPKSGAFDKPLSRSRSSRSGSPESSNANNACSFWKTHKTHQIRVAPARLSYWLVATLELIAVPELAGLAAVSVALVDGFPGLMASFSALIDVFPRLIDAFLPPRPLMASFPAPIDGFPGLMASFSPLVDDFSGLMATLLAWPAHMS